MANDVKSFKQYAKEAKQRMKPGFWQDYRDKLERETARAEEAGVAPSRFIEYYMKKTERTLRFDCAEEDAFYEKVKKILDEEGEVTDVIGRLTEKGEFDRLTYDQKQRYTLELSQRYRRALERYAVEKEFEFSKNNA